MSTSHRNWGMPAQQIRPSTPAPLWAHLLGYGTAGVIIAATAIAVFLLKAG